MVGLIDERKAMQIGGALEQRGRALENEFVRRVDEKLAADLRAQLQAEALRKHLAEASGLTDVRLLDALIQLKITAESLIAMMLVPLVQVAWADGKVEDAERDAILQAAADNNWLPDSVAYQLLGSWLDALPSPSLMQTWKDYTLSVVATLSPPERQTLKDKIINNVRTVAAAAGGILGIRKISTREDQILADVTSVFEAI
jgi:hypothetical protein